MPSEEICSPLPRVSLPRPLPPPSLQLVSAPFPLPEKQRGAVLDTLYSLTGAAWVYRAEQVGNVAVLPTCHALCVRQQQLLANTCPLPPFPSSSRPSAAGHGRRAAQAAGQRQPPPAAAGRRHQLVAGG